MTSQRKQPLINGQYYHIFSRSISKYIIFNNPDEYKRILDLLRLYRHVDFNYKYSQFSNLTIETQAEIVSAIESENSHLVQIIAYCIMPTHVHLLLKQTIDNGISRYMNRVLNSYSRYFNTKHHRNGPLWSSRFNSIMILKDEQLLHLTRYIHLNPTSAGIVTSPEEWEYSSYLEYSDLHDQPKSFCRFRDSIDLTPREYRRFVLDRKSYQKDLSLIKHLIIDDYSG